MIKVEMVNGRVFFRHAGNSRMFFDIDSLKVAYPDESGYIDSMKYDLESEMFRLIESMNLERAVI